MRPCRLEGGQNLGQARVGAHGLSRRNGPAAGPCERRPIGAGLCWFAWLEIGPNLG